MSEYITKDSGKREEYASGMKRDTTEGKPRYDLIPLPMLTRLAGLYARGAEKYGEHNWKLANSRVELDRFKASAFRHFVSWQNGEIDEDHATGAIWNIIAYETILAQMNHKPGRVQDAPLQDDDLEAGTV